MTADRPPALSRLTDALRAAGSRPTVVFRVVALVLVAGMCALVVVPLLSVAAGEFVGAQRSPFAEIAAEGRVVGVLTTTLLVVVGATLIATLIGSTFAWLNERTDANLGRVGEILPVLPLLVPPLAGAIGWVLLASPGPGFLNVALRGVAAALGVEVGQEGPLDIFSWYGLVFVYVLYLVPHVYLTVGAALRNLDPSLEEASRISGAGPIRTVRRVTLPAVAPAIAGGALLALVFGLALFSVPILIGTPAGIDVLSVVVVRLMTFGFPPEVGQAIAYGAIMVVLIGAALLTQALIVKRGRQATIGGRAARSSRVELGRWRAPARAAMVFYLAATSVLPLLALVMVSLQPFWTASINFSVLDLDNYVEALTSRGSGTAFRNSLLLGVVGATVAMLLAAVIAFSTHRLNRPVARLVEGVTKLPGAFSHVVLAVAFVAVFVGPPFQLQGPCCCCSSATSSRTCPRRRCRRSRPWDRSATSWWRPRPLEPATSGPSAAWRYP